MCISFILLSIVFAIAAKQIVLFYILQMIIYSKLNGIEIFYLTNSFYFLHFPHKTDANLKPSLLTVSL